MIVTGKPNFSGHSCAWARMVIGLEPKYGAISVAVKNVLGIAAISSNDAGIFGPPSRPALWVGLLACCVFLDYAEKYSYSGDMPVLGKFEGGGLLTQLLNLPVLMKADA